MISDAVTGLSEEQNYSCNMKTSKLFLIIMLIMLFTACADVSQTPIVEPTIAPTAAPTEEAPALTDILGTLSYSGVFPDHPITLVDGYYYYSEGGSGKPYVRLIDNLIVTGDINHDGVEDAVFLLEDNSEGSSRYSLLAAVLNVRTDPKQVEVIQVEDRIAVKSLSFDGSQVIAEYIGHGSGDVDCCPTWNVRKVFEFQDGRLIETNREELGKVSVEDLNGTNWRLIDLNGNQEPVLPDTEITLNIDQGQISGFAGCNNYNSSVTGDQEFLNKITVGPISATQKMCTDPTSNQESAYLARLGNVEKWAYDYGHLVLFYPQEDNTFGELTYELRLQDMKDTDQTKPNAIIKLETAYGSPSQAGFGSTVFYEQNKSDDDLEKLALEKYRYFVGNLWERFGEDAWMAPWKQVYARKSGEKHDIVAELRGITDPEAAISVPMILDNLEGAQAARAALSRVYDDPAITDLSVFNLGDGGAMSGILLAGRNQNTGEIVLLVFLMD